MNCLKILKGSSTQSPSAAWTVLSSHEQLGQNWGAAQFLQVGQEQVGLKLEITHSTEPPWRANTPRLGTSKPGPSLMNLWICSVIKTTTRMKSIVRRSEEFKKERTKRKDLIFEKGIRRKEDPSNEQFEDQWHSSKGKRKYI
jgi:hypothetical protein